MEKKATKKAGTKKKEKKNQIPIDRKMLYELIDYVDAQLIGTDCEHTLLHSEKFLKAHDLYTPEIVAWLKKNGGGCDCEVLANIEDTIDEFKAEAGDD